MKSISKFDYYGPGQGATDTRTVRMFKRGDKWIVDIQGQPDFSKSFTDERQAFSTFLGAYEASQKDWGTSEIEWSEDLTPKQKGLIAGIHSQGQIE